MANDYLIFTNLFKRFSIKEIVIIEKGKATTNATPTPLIPLIRKSYTNPIFTIITTKDTKIAITRVIEAVEMSAYTILFISIRVILYGYS
nr:hypothetical protein [Maribacter ulvicola]